MKRLDPNQKMDIGELLKDLENYHPRRTGWSWRKEMPNQKMGPFTYKETSAPLDRSVPLPASKYFGWIDPQPANVITTEIASGRFEDDIRRMRMAAWHGADHMMVIRTAARATWTGFSKELPREWEALLSRGSSSVPRGRLLISSRTRSGDP